jgi:hypothetical protein
VRLVKLGDLIDNTLSYAYGLHDLGADWARSFFLPIAEEMRQVVARSRFARLEKTASLLLRELDFALARLRANLAKF